MSDSSTGSKTPNKKLEKIVRRLDIITVILLIKAGLTRKEIAKILGVSEKTIQRMLPIEKLKPRREE